MNNIEIEECDIFKDLGVLYTDKCKFNIHINNICSKAYTIINIIFRCFATNNYSSILKAYITYARQKIKYNSSIWNLGNDYKGLINKLKNIQRYFTKRLFSRCNIPYIEYPDMLLFLNINSL